MQDEGKRAAILWTVLLLGVAFSLRNLWFSYRFTGGVMNAFNLYWKRVTLADPSTTIPYPLEAAVLATVFLVNAKGWLKRSILFVVGALSVTGFTITLTRSMELAFALVGGALVLLMVWRRDWRTAGRIVAAGLVVVLFGVFGLFPKGDLAAANLQRNVTQAATDLGSGRGKEFRGTTAWLTPGTSQTAGETESGFVTKALAVLVGKGAGHPLWHRDDGTPVPYVHNIVLWLFLDTGLLGVAVFIGLILAFFKQLIPLLHKPAWSPTDWAVLSMFAGIATLLLFANFFAVFRLIHFNILAAILLGGVLALSGAVQQGGA